MTASSQVIADPEVAAYARQVREALADVPAARLEELLEDLEEHLVEVAAETPGPLTDRLGPAVEYAAELRRAAGLPESAAEHAEPGGWRRDLRRHRTTIQAHPATAQVRSFLPELRPAWWVLRAWAAVAALDYAVQGEVTMPLPSLGLGVIGWLLTGAAIVWSVRLGLRARTAGRRLTHPIALANLALAVCTLIAVIGVADRTLESVYPEPVSYDSGPTTLTHEDGTPITNIVPYSRDGEPLDGVLLYDQDGRPIDNLSTYTLDSTEVSRQEVTPPQPANAYPQRQTMTSYDEYGNPTETAFPVPTAEATPTAAQATAAPTSAEEPTSTEVPAPPPTP